MRSPRHGSDDAVTVHEHVAAARTRLCAAGIPRQEADRDARLLARWLLGWDASRFWTNANDDEPAGFDSNYEALVARRVAREPVAYITGRQEFWGLSFEVSPAVLIPRPETELIVETVLECLPDRSVSIDVADVGTGSGCLAVALARELPNAHLAATDVSPVAIEVAQRNASRHGVADRIDFACADLLTGVEREFHLIVANPPYVPEADRPTLQPEVRDHEPATALFGGDSGLVVLRRLIGQSAAHLKLGGLLIFEFGFGQAGDVREMMAQTRGLAERDVRADLQGIPRVAMAQRT
jgi:release factor glutamine methyltransferase